nr:unnamed protein product [Digitaria exilis]
MPRAVPGAYPKNDAPVTGEPAAVDEVCVPWPSVSRGESTAMVTFSLAIRPLLNLRAPMSFRLHAFDPSNAVPDSQAPFHRAGIGGSPSSRPPGALTPRNSGVCVVSRFTAVASSRWHDTNPRDRRRASRSSARSRAANPCAAWS